MACLSKKFFLGFAAAAAAAAVIAAASLHPVYDWSSSLCDAFHIANIAAN